MKYMLLIYGDEARREQMSEADRAAEMPMWMQYNMDLQAAGVLLAGDAPSDQPFGARRVGRGGLGCACNPVGDGAGCRHCPAYVTVDGHPLGVIAFADRMREGLPEFVARLRELGLTRTLLLSGDHEENVAPVARALGITEARGDLLPEQKVDAVRALEREGRRVLMVGDGTNDAPALSAATVGVALAAHGGGISAEAAVIVLLADDVTRVEDAVRIGQRTVTIAKQSIVAGLLLSGAAMVVAALGFIPPTVGALLQEGIDVAVILNALRAAADPRAASGSQAS